MFQYDADDVVCDVFLLGGDKPPDRDRDRERDRDAEREVEPGPPRRRQRPTIKALLCTGPIPLRQSPMQHHHVVRVPCHVMFQ